ncbi:hypothetical protein MMMDOFMJ_2711 [Methylobacterium gnaphalii]|nr:hypothetical protein MMMDOFMJ_2711 [Methylobacterium gnaphalii]
MHVWQGVCRAVGDEFRLRHVEERSSEPDALRERPLAAHTGEPCRAAAGDEPHQHGFRLVVGSMGCKHQIRADRGGMGSEQPITGSPCRGLDAAARLCLPAQDVVRETERLREAANGLGFATGIGPQAMVDRGDGESDGWRGGCGGVHQRRRVRAARYRQEHTARGRPIAKVGSEGACQTAAVLTGGHAAQRARFCSRSTL